MCINLQVCKVRESEWKCDGDMKLMHDIDGKLAVVGYVIEIGCGNHPLLNAVLGNAKQIAAPDAKSTLPSLDLSSITKDFANHDVFRYVIPKKKVSILTNANHLIDTPDLSLLLLALRVLSGLSALSQLLLMSSPSMK